MITILGTGQVGRAIFDQLWQKMPDYEILLVNKSGRVPFEMPEGTRISAIDVTNSENLIPIFQKSEIVFSSTDVPYQFWANFYPLLSNAMVEGLKQSDAKLVFADNMYSYGNLKGQFIHEGLPHTAKTNKGKIRTSVINDLFQDQIKEKVAIIKSSDFIGPRIEKGVFGLDFLKNIYNQKTIFLPGKVNLPHHFTFIEDFAKAMVMVAFDPKGYNEIWHVPNAAAISQKEWIELFEQETKERIRYRSIPKMAISVIGLFNPFVKELKELSYQFEYPYIVESQKFIKHFGDISTTHQEIIKKTIEWYKLNL